MLLLRMFAEAPEPPCLHRSQTVRCANVQRPPRSGPGPAGEELHSPTRPVTDLKSPPPNHPNHPSAPCRSQPNSKQSDLAPRTQNFWGGGSEPSHGRTRPTRNNVHVWKRQLQIFRRSVLSVCRVTLLASVSFHKLRSPSIR